MYKKIQSLYISAYHIVRIVRIQEIVAIITNKNNFIS